MSWQESALFAVSSFIVRLVLLGMGGSSLAPEVLRSAWFFVHVPPALLAYDADTLYVAFDAEAFHGGTCHETSRQ